MSGEKVTLKVEITMSKKTWDAFWDFQKTFAKQIVKVDVSEAVDTIIIDEEEAITRDEKVWTDLLAYVGTGHVMHLAANIVRDIGL